MLALTNLAGFMGPGSLRVRPTVLSATSTSATITIPAAAPIGSFAVLFDQAGAIGTPSDVTPTNWTSDGDATAVNSGTHRLRVSAKIIAAGEPGSSVTGMNASNVDKVMFVFVGSSPFKSFAFNGWAAQATTGDPSSQAWSAISNRPVIVCAMAGCTDAGGSTVDFSTETPAFTAKVTNGDADIRCGYTIYNGASAAQSTDMDDIKNGNCLASGAFILS